nr:hypothetical protein [uncultured Acetatifactor sp.]
MLNESWNAPQEWLMRCMGNDQAICGTDKHILYWGKDYGHEGQGETAYRD